jgi:hypothetical protein
VACVESTLISAARVVTHVAVKITAAAPIAAATFGLWFTMFSPYCTVVHACSFCHRRDLGLVSSRWLY